MVRNTLLRKYFKLVIKRSQLYLKICFLVKTLFKLIATLFIDNLVVTNIFLVFRYIIHLTSLKIRFCVSLYINS
jgi:uncharacterized membrane protein YeiH